LIFWPLDLNPDEAIAAGWLKEHSPGARFLTRLLMSSMKTARSIIALDEFMKQRIVDKGISADKIDVIPPAPYDSVSFDPRGREEFRRTQKLTDKFVVMYAGNHSPCHPLDTLLQAARELKRHRDVVFLFVGGGSELRKVKSFARLHPDASIRCLNYLPNEQISALLSAADLHVVVLGDAFNGIVHPSKIYNVLKVGKPFLFIGPDESFVTKIINAQGDSVGVSVRHSETKQVVAAILKFVRQQAKTGHLKTPDNDQADFARFIAHIEAIDLQKSSARPATDCAGLATSQIP
jgi:glycosyltransferase involved in cell wall biosynthesis